LDINSVLHFLRSNQWTTTNEKHFTAMSHSHCNIEQSHGHWTLLTNAKMSLMHLYTGWQWCNFFIPICSVRHDV